MCCGRCGRCDCIRARSRTGSVGRIGPRFVLPGLAGSKPVTLESFPGRPMVINFWASWCVPCRQEMPDLQAAHVLLGEQVEFVGVVHRDLRSAAIDFVRETGVTYPSGFDPAGSVAASYGLIGLPSTFLVAADGVVVAEVRGELTKDKLLELIADRLGISVQSPI